MAWKTLTRKAFNPIHHFTVYIHLNLECAKFGAEIMGIQTINLRNKCLAYFVASLLQ